MREYLPELSRVPLFRGITAGELLSVLDCLGARAVRYPKGAAVFQAGDPARYVGAVLRGRVQISREDALGGRMVLASIPAGGLFGEAYACAGETTLPVSVRAAAESVILLLDCGRVVRACPSACAFHSRLVTNLLGILAEKNLSLSRKLEHLSKGTIREKLLSYLGEQAALAGTNTFAIPFDRQELADYLCADRSALSRELGKLRREGVVRSEKNQFTLLRPGAGKKS